MATRPAKKTSREMAKTNVVTVADIADQYLELVRSCPLRIIRTEREYKFWGYLHDDRHQPAHLRPFPGGRRQNRPIAGAGIRVFPGMAGRFVGEIQAAPSKGKRVCRPCWVHRTDRTDSLLVTEPSTLADLGQVMRLVTEATPWPPRWQSGALISELTGDRVLRDSRPRRLLPV